MQPNGLDALIQIPAAQLVSGLETQIGVMSAGRFSLPVTRNEGRRTSYLCCPSAAYIDYGVDELRHFDGHPLLKACLRILLEMARPVMAASGFDRQVQPNNWLVSTNLLPDLSTDDIEAATEGLVRRLPGHAVVWRSVNDYSTAALKQRFEAAGYRALASRRIYMFDARNTAPAVHRDERRDMKLLDRADYALVGPKDMQAEDFQRMAWLYRRLYIDKYTGLNPAYTPLFFERAHASGLLEFRGLRSPDGRLDGIIGFMDKADTMTAPIVGYDTDAPVEAGLYRRLMALALRRAREQRRLYNMSAGAGAFKRHRGGVASLEYMMVYDRHLGPFRSALGLMVRGLVNSIGVPLLQRFDL